MLDYQKEFIQYALDCDVLKFGEFKLKSRRVSPYFFNTGLFNTGETLAQLGRFYAQTLIESKLDIDVLYGPAYKGIPLASATSIAYSQLKHDLPFAFNRKEVKNHGEGGLIVGSPLHGKILIIDDVITAGTSIGESVEIIKQMGAEPAGALIALDRQEKGENNSSAVEDVSQQFNMPVISIISLSHIIEYLELADNWSEQLEIIKQYRLNYGI
ncbi:MAG: orotate phosphoribosyltransferase [Methylococcales symbiont of Hymedesmia sp. n. MRB-2018]|nr:MAG: orotate phosphoribosyltransferase [Methylococcales symbiont of Hymedesmia sp. n. MRB-2018]